MKYQLLLFDLDDTLLRSDKTISDFSLQALKACREKGMRIGISTSRSEQNSLVFIDELRPDIIISSGGALVKYNGTYIYEAGFTEEETIGMIQTARYICGTDCLITIDTVEKHYWNYKGEPKQYSSDPNQYKGWDSTIYTDFKEFTECALKMCVEIPDPAIAVKLQETLDDCDSVKFSDGDWYKFTKKSVTKESAILHMCGICGITPEEIIAFGDDYSDIGMLKLCGKGIAMGNAVEAVKMAADEVIGDNNNDGIAHYLMNCSFIDNLFTIRYDKTEKQNLL